MHPAAQRSSYALSPKCLLTSSHVEKFEAGKNRVLEFECGARWRQAFEEDLSSQDCSGKKIFYPNPFTTLAAI
jgi:hypothetical protein